jgi:hypothetical protein
MTNKKLDSTTWLELAPLLEQLRSNESTDLDEESDNEEDDGNESTE